MSVAAGRDEHHPSPGARRDELAANLGALRRRVDAACAAAGRSPEEVTTVVVTKTFPVTDVVHLAGLGVTDVGESRDQEAAAKTAHCRNQPGTAQARLRWHFVGRLQTNKAASVASYADVLHSLDRPKLVPRLSRAAQDRGSVLTCLLQVSLDEDPDRGGVAPQQVPGLAETVAAAPGLELRGVMAVAPRGADPARAFARLVDVAERLRADHPAATWVSAGMSGDLEDAVRAGATHLRVGGAVLGSRPPLG